MPIIQTYQDRVAAQGNLTARASGESFGAGVAQAKVAEAQAQGSIGAALQNVGMAAGNLSLRMQKLEEDKGRLWASKAASDLELGVKTSLIERTTNADPRTPEFKNFADDFGKHVDEEIAKVAESAPNQYARDFLDVQGRQLRNQMYFHAAQTQSSLSGQYLKELADQGLENEKKLVQQDFSNESFRTSQNRIVETVNGLKTDGVDKEKLTNKHVNEIAVSQVQAFIAHDSAGFLRSIGQPPKLVSAPAAQSGTAQQVAANQPTLPNDEFGQMATGVGLSGPGVALARAVYAQESGSGRAKTDTPNYAGAIGPMQVTRQTFEGLKKQGAIPQSAEFTNPKDTMNAGLVLISQLYKQYGGNQEQVLAAYYAGPKAVRADGSIKYGIRDLKNPKAPTVGGYVAQAMARLGPTDPGAEIAAAPPAAIAPATDEQITGALSKLDGWQYLTAEQRVQAVRMAESQVAKGLADDRAALEREIKDRTAMIADGKIPPDITSSRYSRENLVRVFGEDVGGRAAEGMKYQIDVSNAMASVRTMTPAQVQEMAQVLEPTSPENYADKRKSYAAFVEAAKQIDTYRRENPMQWALDVGLNDAKAIDFTSVETMAVGLKGRSIVAVNMATNYGTRPQILTQDEADVFARRLDTLAPPDKIKMLEATRLSFGQDTQGRALFQTMMGQISDKTPMVSVAANLSTKIGNMSAGGVTQSASTVAEYIMEGEYILRGGKLGDATNTSKPSDFDETMFKLKFNTLMGSAFRNLDGQTGAKVSSQAYQAAKNYLAADAFRSGIDLKTASSDQKRVERAVTMTIGNVWKRSSGVGDDDRLVAPWGYPPERFQNEFNARAQAAINAAGLTGTNLDSLDSYSFDNVGDGVYAFRYGGRYLVGKDGKQVVVDYSKPMPMLTQTASRGASGNTPAVPTAAGNEFHAAGIPWSW